MHFGTLAEVQAGIATRRVKWDRDYQVKHGITTGPAEGLSEAEVEKLSHLAKRIYRALHMCGFARLDFRMRNDGKVFLLEANANPDLTFGEDFAESAESVGLGYKKLIGRIVSLGLSGGFTSEMGICLSASLHGESRSTADNRESAERLLLIYSSIAYPEPGP
jgi:D-alanine-D-alanine ligase